MFVLCFQIINTETIRLIKKYGLRKLPRLKNMKIGKRVAAEILDKDTNLDLARTIKKIPRDANPTFQERAKNIPNPVATALPPLPFSHIGHICPEMAAIPAKTSIKLVSV